MPGWSRAVTSRPSASVSLIAIGAKNSRQPSKLACQSRLPGGGGAPRPAAVPTEMLGDTLREPSLKHRAALRFRCSQIGQSVFWWKRLRVRSLHLGLSRLVIRIWAVETNTFSGACIVDVSAEHVPPLTEVQHSVMSSPCPTFRCDPHTLFLGHLQSSC